MAKKIKLPETYMRLKSLSHIIEDICKDIDLRGYGFEPGVQFASIRGYSLELPEWFLVRLNNYIDNLKDNQ